MLALKSILRQPGGFKHFDHWLLMAPSSNPAMRPSDQLLTLPCVARVPLMHCRVDAGDFHCRPIWPGSLSSICAPALFGHCAGARWQLDLQIVSLDAPSSSMLQCFLFLTNIFCNLDKYILQFVKMNTAGATQLLNYERDKCVMYTSRRQLVRCVRIQNMIKTLSSLLLKCLIRKF